MKTKQIVKVNLICAAMLVVLFGVASCTRRINNQSEQPVEQANESSWQIYSEPALPEETDTELNWTRYSDERFTFDYPVGWFVKVDANHLELKNIEKEIITGGAAPEDYYLDGATAVNVEKYAIDYFLLTIDVYEQTVDWDQFFADKFNGVVLSYQPYFLPTRPELAGVAPTKVAGVIYGDQRFFVKKGNSIYDFSLFNKGLDVNQAQKILNTFLKNFFF